MEAVIKVYWDVSPYDINPQIQEGEKVFIIPFGAMITNPTAQSGIQSVNNKTGEHITLNYSDVGAEPIGSVNALRVDIDDQIGNLNDTKADLSYVNSVDSSITAQVNLKANKTYVDSQDQALATSIADKSNKVYVDQQDSLLQDQIDLKADAQAVNQALTTKADLVNGVIPANQLPSFVDDVIEYPNLSSFPTTGESGKIYIAMDVNKTYRWSGSTYVEIGGGGVALGETSATAYRGDRGKIAYDHSQSQGNPHNTITTQIPEGTNLYFTEPRVRLTPLAGFVPVTGGSITNSDTVLQAFGKTQDQINNINQFSETKVQNTLLTNLLIGNALVTATDSVLSAFGKLQGQLNNLTSNFATTVRNTLLTGLSIPSSASAITASDTVLTAMGKLQKSVTDAATGITWVHHSQVGTFVTPANWNMTYTNLYFARYGGMLWMKGKVLPTVTVATSANFFTITNDNYKIKTIGVNQINSKILASQQEQTALIFWAIRAGAIISDAATAAGVNETISSMSSMNSGNVFTIHTTGIEELAIP
jgi:hypothetical protein